MVSYFIVLVLFVLNSGISLHENEVYLVSPSFRKEYS